MKSHVSLKLFLFLAVITTACAAQQKAQWVPGQYGLNAGVAPDPGFTYANMALYFSYGQLNDRNGDALPGITGHYGLWVDENIFYFIPKKKILGGYFEPYADVNFANGNLVLALKGTRWISG